MSLRFNISQFNYRFTFILILLLRSPQTNSVPLAEKSGIHQLCKKLEWVGEPTINRLSSSSSFSDCVNLKLYTAPNSPQLFVTVSATNRHTCATFKIQYFALTLVALPSNAEFYDSAIPAGTWSKIPPETKPPILPSRFPRAYLQSNSFLSTATCSSDDNPTSSEFFESSNSSVNSLVFKGLLSPGTGVAAKVTINFPSGDPIPIQLGAEFLVGIDPEKTLNYWIFDGSSRELVYFPNLQMIKFSTNPTGKLFLLNPTFYPTSTPPKSWRPTRQAVSRNTYMCSCKDPTRAGGGLTPVDPTLPIPEIDSTSPLAACFELRLVNCPGSLTSEKLGAVFIQKPCAAQPDIRTIDISFTVLNDKGFAYGELVSNQLIRPCFDKIGGGNGVKGVLPVLHLQKPVQYTCSNGFAQSDTLFTRDPVWISVDADFQVPPGGKPRAVQVMLRDKINTGSGSFPDQLRMVAEFSVELTPGGAKEIHRVMSETFKLTFLPSGEIDWSKTTALPTASNVAPDPNYLAETTALSCGSPQSCTTCVTPDPTHFLCRKIMSDVASTPVTPSASIEPCLKTVFNHPSIGSPEIFFVSLHVDQSVGGCSGMVIIQAVMMVLERDETGIRVAGTFETVEDRDLILGKCKDSASTATKLEPGGVLSRESCVSGSNDFQLYYVYRDIADRMACAKWTYSSISSSTKAHEIQAGVKLYYKDGTTEHHLIHRIPTIYEVTPSGAAISVEELILERNERTDILLTSALPTFAGQPHLKLPTYRNTHMCACTNPRVFGGTVPQMPADTFTDIDPSVTTDPLNSCFQFAIVRCPGSLSKENLGAIFVQVACAADPKTVDISFVALNENGFVYGELEVNRLVRPCFADIVVPSGVMAYQPIIHDMDPVSYKCQGFPETLTLYKDPSWLTVKADMEVPAGEKPRAIQVMIKNKIVKDSPKEIQFVAEFSVEKTGGGKELRRITSDRAALKFTAGGDIDWSTSTLNNKAIPASPDYLVDSGTATSCPAPSQCATCQPVDRTSFLCRKYEPDAAATSVTDSNAIVQCLRTVFNYGTGNEFFVSIEMDTGMAACTNMKIIQSIFMILERDGTQVQAVGTWDKADATADFVVNKCKDSGSSATTLQNFLKFSIESCTAPPGATDKKLYHNYQDVGDRMVCGKFLYTSTSTTLRELQAGMALYYEDATTGNKLKHVLRMPIIYEVSGTGTAITANKIIIDRNDRINIYWSPNLPSAPVRVPEFRKTHMCKCVSPRRNDPGSTAVPQMSTNVIPDLVPPNPLDPLANCFRFKIASCPGSLTAENLGAVFFQDKCTSDPDVETIDIFFIALNENGYPYGELQINNLVRPCFTTVGGPDGVASHTPIIHFQNPISYKCTGIPESLALYKDPGWLSVRADFQVPATATNPRAVQVMLKNKIKSGTAQIPKEIQFVAEFSLKLTSGATEFRRIITERMELKFTSGGDIDWTAMSGAPPLTPPISPHSDYLTEAASGGTGVCPNAPTTPTVPALDPKFFLCRRIDADISGVALDPKIEPCIRGLFTYDATATGTTVFYASFEVDSSVAGCSGIKVLQSLFMVLERDKSKRVPVGAWEFADETTDFVVGKCKDGTSKATALQSSLQYSIDDCEPKKGKDMRVYHNYKEVDDRMVCAKWTYGSTSTEKLREIQAGVKFLYNDGTNDFLHVVRLIQLYELTFATSGSSVIEKVVLETNPRTDILLGADPPSYISEPPIGFPKPRESHMCGCRNPRRQSSPTVTPLLIEDTLPAKIANCFDFKLAGCLDSHTDEVLGAIFALKSVTSGCTLGVTLVDISVVAINDKGFGYGVIEANKDLDMCIAPGNPYPDVFNVKPVVHEILPVQYDCDVHPGSLHTQPKWLSIAADVKSEDAFPGYQATIFQFVLKDKVKTATGPDPKSIQFIAEFGVIEGTNPYQIYRIRSDHRVLAFDASGKVNFAGSTADPNDIDLHSDYLDEFGGTCPPASPNPTPPTWTMDFLCQCVDKCSGTKCGPPDPDIDECFEVLLNHPPGSTAPEFFMSVRKEPGPKCPKTGIVIHDVMFTALKLVHGKPPVIDATMEWAFVDPVDFTTVGHCIDTASTTLKPQRSSRFGLKDCESGSTMYTSAFFWHYRDLDDTDKIMCAKLKIPAPTGTMDVQSGYKIIYSDGGGSTALKVYIGMHPKIFQITGGSPPMLLYDKKNERVGLRTKTTFKKTCFTAPEQRPSHMCECLNPLRPQGPKITTPVVIPELEDDTTGLKNCFEFKMVDCTSSHTGERLGVVFIQKGEACGKPDLTTIEMSVVAINEDGYPYGEMEIQHASGECLDTTPGATDGILNYRPVVNELREDESSTVYNYETHQCNIQFPERSKYVDASGTIKSPKWLAVGLKMTSDFSGTGALPRIIQFMLKEPVMTGPTHPATLQFIAEFTYAETLPIPGSGSAVEAFRVASEHRRLSFTGNQVDFSSSAIETAVPRIELHPDYIDVASNACDPKNSGRPSPPIPNLKWDTCNCFLWEEKDSIPPPSAVEVGYLFDCLTLAFNYDPSITTTPTFFFSVAKLSPKGTVCSDLVIEQFVLTMLGRNKMGHVTTMNFIGTWDRADLLTEYVPGKCLQMSATVTNYDPQKTGANSVRPCVNEPVSTPATYFYYRGLRRDGEVNCGKWEVQSPPLAFQEIQVLYKIHYFKTATAGTKWKYVGRYPLIFEIKGATVNPITKEDLENVRINLLHTQNPLPNGPGGAMPICLETPFVPTSDICDCTETRQGGFKQKPDQTLVEELALAIPPVQIDCFEFKMHPCTLEGKTFDTIGAILIINTPTSPTPCTEDIVVEDISFQAINGLGFPFGEPKYSKYSRACFQPEDLLQYEIKSLHFTRAIDPKCDQRKKASGGDFKNEFQYGQQFPTWVQVEVNAEIQNLEKPIAVQIYLEKPSRPPSATQIQFIAEMVISDRAPGGRREILRIKTPVYNFGYMKGSFDPVTLVEDTTLMEIERSDDYYETDDSHRFCHSKEPPVSSFSPALIQQCGCLSFTDGIPPIGSLLDGASPLYMDNIEKCIFYDFSSMRDPLVPAYPASFFFYLTVWTKTQAEESVCGDFQIVGVTLTPLIRVNAAKLPTSPSKGQPQIQQQEGKVFGDWYRTTVFAPGYTPTGKESHNASRGTNCAMNTMYTGKLRRLPFDFARDCSKLVPPEKDRLLLFYYPLMNQDDLGNAFCGALKIDDYPLGGSSAKRFEFQISAYLFLDFPALSQKYYAIKRSRVFEYIGDIAPSTVVPPGGTPPPLPNIGFPAQVFEVQDESQQPQMCDIDICMYD